MSKLTFNQENEDALGSSGFRERLFSNKPFNPQQLSKLFDKILTFYENNGFPFANIKLDSTTFNNGQMSSKLLINKGPLIRIDSIFVKGEAENSNILIYNILQFAKVDTCIVLDNPKFCKSYLQMIQFDISKNLLYLI